VARSQPMSGERVRAETLRILRAGGDADEVRQVLGQDQAHAGRVLDPYLDALLELLVEVYALTGATRAQPIQLEKFLDRYLGEYEFRGKVDERSIRYAPSYPALVHGGVVPDISGDLYHWNSEMWPYVLYALQGYLRVAAERTGKTPSDLAQAVPD